MKSLKTSLALSVISLAVLSCAQPQVQPEHDDQFDADLCSEQMGYERGMNDGRSGKTMSSKFTLRCREDLRASAQKGYREGYQEGSKVFQEEQKNRRDRQPPVVGWPNPTGTGTTTTGSGRPSININIGGSQNTVPAAATSSNPRAYFCKVRAFTTDFEDFGTTKLEAQKKVQGACATRYHRMHCEDVECQVNE
ncbi:MAG: hypothetical protein AB1540_15760 [Bdellovibrionota bacterium]